MLKLLLLVFLSLVPAIFASLNEDAIGNSIDVLLQQLDIPVYTECGGIIEGYSGRIEYKLDENYDNSVRCAWVLRHPTFAMGIHINKTRSGFELGQDYITVFGFASARDDHQTKQLGQITNKSEETYLSYPTAVVVVFTSNSDIQGTGFQLDFAFDNTTAGADSLHTFFSSDVEGTYRLGGPDPTDHYGNGQYSIFVMSRNNTYYTDIGWRASLHVFKLEEDDDILDPCRFGDRVEVHSVARDTITSVGRFCSNTEITFGPFLARNLYIFIFATDVLNDQGGFEISWRPI